MADAPALPITGQFTVTAVSDKVRDVEIKGNQFKSYKMHVRTSTGDLLKSVEWLRIDKADKPAAPPVKGQQIDGTIEDGKYGPKFKLAPKTAGPGGFGFNRPRDPAERRSIAMQTAIKAAVELVAPADLGGALRAARVFFQEIQAAEADTLTAPAPLAPSCRCGHGQSEHGCSTGPLTVNWGPCFIEGCGCRQYTSAGSQ